MFTIYLMFFIFICKLTQLHSFRDSIEPLAGSKRPIFVGGASNKVGFNLVRLLSMKGENINVIARQTRITRLLNELPGVYVYHGNITDSETVQKALQHCDRAVACVRGTQASDERVEYVANSNIIEQAGILGIERLLLVTSLGCGSTKESLTPHEYLKHYARIDAQNKVERDLKLYTNLVSE